MVNLFSMNLMPAAYLDFWNMAMNFDAGNFALLPGNALQGTYNFDPFSASSTAFNLEVRTAAGALVTSTGIAVNVPEPGSLALVGLALAGLATVRRRMA